MKALITFSLSLGITLSAQSQSLSLQVIGTGGAFIESSTGKMSYTVGEVVTPSIIGSANTLTQGFQQPSDIVSGLLDSEQQECGAFSVYPIPATEQLWLGYSFPKSGTVEVCLFNVLGQKMDFSFNEVYFSGKIVRGFSCEQYANGNYVLRLTFISDTQEKTVFDKKIQFNK